MNSAVGAAARVAFSQIPSAVPLYIASAEDGETTVETLAKAAKTDGWYCVCPAGTDEGEFEEIAQWTEAQRKIFGYTYVGETDPVSGIYYRAFGFCGRIYDWDNNKTAAENLESVPGDNKYIHVAAAAKTLTYEPGSETWHLKRLAAVTPSKFSGAFINELETHNTNYFTRFANANVTVNGKVKAGEWIDTIRFRDWLENDMQMYKCLKPAIL